MRTLLIATMLAALTAKAAFFEDEHLLDSPDFSIQYEIVLSRTVFVGYSADSQISFRAMPSFSGEYGFWLSNEKGEWRVHHTRTTKNLWYWIGSNAWGGDSNWGEIGSRVKRILGSNLIESYDRVVPGAIAERLIAEWNRVLVESAPERRPNNLDGAVAVFNGSTPKRGTFSRCSWSPLSGSPDAHLWRIASAVTSFASGGAIDDLEKALSATVEKGTTETQTDTTGNAGRASLPSADSDIRRP